jgi:hypothetical protein
MFRPGRRRRLIPSDFAPSGGLGCLSKSTTETTVMSRKYQTQVADVLTYIRREIRDEVDGDAIKKQRQALSAKPWSSAATDPCSGEIDHPDNRKHNHDRSDAEAEHKPDIVPGRSLSSLRRGYYRPPFGALGVAHDIPFSLLIGFATGQVFPRPNCGCARPPAQPPLRLSVEPIIDVLADEIFGQSVTLLDTAFELIATAVDLSEVVIGQLTPLLLDLAFRFFPVAFNPVPIHGALSKLIACRAR